MCHWCLLLLMFVSQTSTKHAQHVSKKAVAERAPVTTSHSLSPEFTKKAKLAVKALQRQMDAAREEASKKAMAHLNCSYRPLQCKGIDPLADSDSWKAIKLDTAHAVDAADVEASTAEDKRVFNLVGFLQVRTDRFYNALVQDLISEDSEKNKRAVSQESSGVVLCRSYLEHVLDARFTDAEEACTIKEETRKESTSCESDGPCAK